jgi:hypothetical protein
MIVETGGRMERSWRSVRLGLMAICLYLSVAPLSANPYATQNPWQWRYAPPAGQQTAPPSSQQTAPSYQRWPTPQQPGYNRQQQTTTQASKPYLETELSITTPYVQQAVVLKVSIVSQQNLTKATPRIPQSDYYIIQLLEGPKAYSRNRKGKREIVNDFFYQLTPLKAGSLELSPIRVSGEWEQVTAYSRNKIPFDVSSNKPLKLEIGEANPDVEPWLPLEHLGLVVIVPKNYQASAGKPLPVKVELTALGLGGNQLPSLEQQLKSDAFRVYREESRVSTSLNTNYQKISGKRTETFTLVPQYGGDLNLPALHINWWNTRTAMAQRTSFPLQPIAVSGSRGYKNPIYSDEEQTLFPAGSASAFWIPLSIVFGIIFGYWIAVYVSHKRKGDSPHSPLEPLVAFLQRPMRKMAPAFSPLKQKLLTAGRSINPVDRWHRWRRHLVGMLPLSIRFWFCVRFVDEEDDPEVWGFTLRFLANKHMGLPLNAPFRTIGKHILAFHPKAKPEVIHRLIHELEDSVYGHHNIDFGAWKSAFKHEIRPSLRLLPKSLLAQRSSNRSPLPELNP